MTAAELFRRYQEKIRKEELFEIFSQILGHKPHEIFFKSDHIPKRLIQKIDKIVQHRKLGIPLQYILKEVWFFNSPYKINRGVLIPRPETEELVWYIHKNLSHSNYREVLDIGCGSGVLAISLKKLFPTASVTALDISKKACALTKSNAAEILGREDAISVIHSNIFAKTKVEAFLTSKFDCIVSNPPYIPFDDDRVEHSVKNYEPKRALFGGITGLEFYQKLAKTIHTLLNVGGDLFLEVGEGQIKEVSEIFNYFEKYTIIRDINSKPRFFYGYKYGSPNNTHRKAF